MVEEITGHQPSETFMFQKVRVIRRSIMALLLSFVIPSCGPENDGSGFWENEREIIALTQRLKLGQYRLGRSEPDGVAELADLKSRISKNESALDRLLAHKAALTADIAYLQTRNHELARIVLEQKRARTLGMKLETFPARDGRMFKNAVVMMVEDSGVDIRHEHGAARLRYGELSDQQRLFFGLEESASLLAEDRERKETSALERDIDSQLEDIRMREIHASASDGMNSASRVYRSFSPVSFRKPVTSELSKPAKPVGRASFYQSFRSHYVYRSHRLVYRYVHRHVPACVRTSACASYKNIP